MVGPRQAAALDRRSGSRKVSDPEINANLWRNRIVGYGCRQNRAAATGRGFLFVRSVWVLFVGAVCWFRLLARFVPSVCWLRLLPPLVTSLPTPLAGSVCPLSLPVGLCSPVCTHT